MFHLTSEYSACSRGTHGITVVNPPESRYDMQGLATHVRGFATVAIRGLTTKVYAEAR